MTFLTLIMLAGLTLAGADQVIDAFDYDDNAAAQEVCPMDYAQSDLDFIGLRRR